MCWICVCRRQQLFPLRQQHLNFTSFPSVWCTSLIIIMNLSTHTQPIRMYTYIICRRESTFSRVRHWRSFYTVTQIECWMRVWVVYQKKLEGWRFEWRRKLLVFIEINSSFDVAVLYVYGFDKRVIMALFRFLFIFQPAAQHPILFFWCVASSLGLMVCKFGLLIFHVLWMGYIYICSKENFLKISCDKKF